MELTSPLPLSLQQALPTLQVLAGLLAQLALVLLAPPLLLGVITRVKARLAGRRGPPLLQPYRDLRRLFIKGTVRSATTTWVFRAGPIVALSTTLLSTMLVPMAGGRAPLSFPGDLVLLAYLLGLGRFFTIIAAMDTGSAFEGMGAAREATWQPWPSRRFCWAFWPLCASRVRCPCPASWPIRRC